MKYTRRLEIMQWAMVALIALLMLSGVILTETNDRLRQEAFATQQQRQRMEIQARQAGPILQKLAIRMAQDGRQKNHPALLALLQKHQLNVNLTAAPAGSIGSVPAPAEPMAINTEEPDES